MRGAILLLTLAGVAAAQDRPASWMGELVVGKKYAKDTTFGDQVNGKQEWFEFRGIYPITVREDRDGWLRIFDGHREGWAKKDEFVLSKDAPAYFTDRIRADPKDVFAWFSRGLGWLDRGEYDNAIKDLGEVIRLDPLQPFPFNSRGICWYAKNDLDRAIKDYDEAIRLDPRQPLPFNNRGNAWCSKGEYDRAIKDYDEAIRLDPRYANAFRNRGEAWRDKGEYDRAIKDYDEAIRLDPKYASAFRDRGTSWLFRGHPDHAIRDYDEALRLGLKETWPIYGRAVGLLLLRRPGAAAGCRRALDGEGWAGDLSTYAVILGNLAARAEKDGAVAKAFLADSAGKLKADWPEPVVRFLRGDLDEPALLKLATDRDKETEARAYLGLDNAIRGNRDAARAHFRWVKDHGDRTYTEYAIAVAELARLEKGGAAKE